MTGKEFVDDKDLSLYSESIRRVMSEGKKAYANKIISEM
jgi:ribosomal protein S7